MANHRKRWFIGLVIWRLLGQTEDEVESHRHNPQFHWIYPSTREPQFDLNCIRRSARHDNWQDIDGVLAGYVQPKYPHAAINESTADWAKDFPHSQWRYSHMAFVYPKRATKSDDESRERQGKGELRAFHPYSWFLYSKIAQLPTKALEFEIELKESLLMRQRPDQWTRSFLCID